MATLIVWRHPRPEAVQGRCIGRTDVPVDRRKSKRLAHRIRTWARRHSIPGVVITSPKRRCADVGRWLARWGWVHRIDVRLTELDFGAWDGEPWHHIGAAAVQAWCDDFAAHRPGGGESVAALLKRCAAFTADEARSVCIVGHAGWISAALWQQRSGGALPDVAGWPAAIGYGQRVELRATPAADPADPMAPAS
jgi:alpha-ribazole phosphatase